MEKLITELQETGFLEMNTLNGEEILHMKTNIYFRIEESIFDRLKKKYSTNEEIGGILWAKSAIDGQHIFTIEEISIVRNAVEDNPKADRITKVNSYLHDDKKLHQELQNGITNGYLPIPFHTHKFNVSSFSKSLTFPSLLAETSEQAKRKSNLPYIVGNNKLLMPIALIVGNNILDINICFVFPDIFKGLDYKGKLQSLKYLFDNIESIHIENEEVNYRYKEILKFIGSKVKIDVGKISYLKSNEIINECIMLSKRIISRGFIEVEDDYGGGFYLNNEDKLKEELENFLCIPDFTYWLEEFVYKTEWNYRYVQILDMSSGEQTEYEYFCPKYGIIKDLERSVAVEVLIKNVLEYFGIIHKIVKQEIKKSISLRDWMNYFGMDEYYERGENDELISIIDYKKLDDIELAEFDSDDFLNLLKTKIEDLDK